MLLLARDVVEQSLRHLHLLLASIEVDCFAGLGFDYPGAVNC